MMKNREQFIASIPEAFWRSFAYQQICDRKNEFKKPKWSILCNDSGIQLWVLKFMFILCTQGLAVFCEV